MIKTEYFLFFSLPFQKYPKNSQDKYLNAIM